MTSSTATTRVERCFVVIDLVGFTALNDTHGDTLAARLAVALAAHAKVNVRPGIEVVKYLGDGVLVAGDAVGPALGFVDRILERLANDEFPLAVRIGMHEGQAIAIDGDYLGSSLNLVSRLSHEARPGQLVTTIGVADQARTLGLEVTSLGARQLRHVGEPVDLFSVEVAALASPLPLDPVCHMIVTATSVAATIRWRSSTIRFCSAVCADRFSRDPQRYADHLEDC